MYFPAADEIKKLAIALDADKCGIVGIERFCDAPEGFKPTDIYSKAKSVIVFLKRMPEEILLADNPVVYTHTSSMIFSEIDRIAMDLCRLLEDRGIKSVPVPCDTPYIYWDETSKTGRGILSMRHAAYLAGLGILGKNNLLINKEFGNMVYIGAVLTEAELDQDDLVDDFQCKPNCRICLDSCPKNALDGVTVIQSLCRENEIITGRGWTLYGCNKCRRVCPNWLGAR